MDGHATLIAEIRNAHKLLTGEHKNCTVGFIEIIHECVKWIQMAQDEDQEYTSD
jgi:hypothetical protein